MKIDNYRFLFSIIFLCAISVYGTQIKVPEDYSTIQQAIDAAVDGDTVLVAPATYFENINFKGKNIVVTSYFVMSQELHYIEETVIDGSQPLQPDTASCVLFISGEDSTAVLQGFTLTNGTGTKWVDEHGAGTFYEGGGILVTLSSPTIRYNYIVNNEAIRVGSGVTSAGGGGIRVGDGNPRILNNVIKGNEGMYGGGIVLNYTGGIVKNNIICYNKVYEAVSGSPTFGGAGIWVLEDFETAPKIIENNTIIGNSSSGGGSTAAGRGGGLLVWATDVEFKNNIVWGNTQSRNGQIIVLNSTGTVISYNCVEGGYSGTGNIGDEPSFADSSFLLLPGSPCVDAGDPGMEYNDPEDSGNPGNALFPSLGGITNDMGAYGGGGRGLLPNVNMSLLDIPNSFDFGTILINELTPGKINIRNTGSVPLSIDSVVFSGGTAFSITTSLPVFLHVQARDSINLTWQPLSAGSFTDTLWVYHQAETPINPKPVIITGEAVITGVEDNDDGTVETYLLAQNYPNPFNPLTVIQFELPTASQVRLTVYDALGNKAAELVNGRLAAGRHTAEFNAADLSSGVYLYRLEAEGFTNTKKMLLLK